MSTTPSQTPPVASIFERLRGHAFHPLDADRFTVDRHLGRHGIADLNDPDWRQRLLAVRDLVRCGRAAAPGIAAGLGDADLHVRYAAATALGILRADESVDELERVAREDGDALARSPAVVALGEMESRASLDLLRECRARDPSRDVRHQAELAIYQIERQLGATRALEETWRMLDDSVFGWVEVGETAPDFTLADADGEPWCLREVNERGWVVLIWIFAHWCPVCHREFSELIELREEFERHHVQVATLECHDRYRCRVMTGRELEPDYWFADHSFQDTYTAGIWWPHLSDRAGAVGARYGIDPMAFSVHAEYINRPATVIVDPAGIVRLAYFGTYWGDRPSIEQTLEMIRNGHFDFEHPDRLPAARGERPGAGKRYQRAHNPA